MHHQSSFRRLPEGVLCKGVNITVSPAAGESNWPALWDHWPWNKWIKPQIDKALSIGMNCLKIIGALSFYKQNPSAYQDHIRQYCNYALSNGLWILAGIAEADNHTEYFADKKNVTRQELDVYQRDFTDQTRVWASFPNVFAIDLMTEIPLWQDNCGWQQSQLNKLMAAALAGARIGAPDLPATCSTYGYDDATCYTDVSALMVCPPNFAGDFFEMHIYGDSSLGNPDQMMDTGAPYAGKQLLLGEIGVSLTGSRGGALRTQMVPRIRSSHFDKPYYQGLLWWAAADQNKLPNTDDMWGLWANIDDNHAGGSLRQDVIDTLDTITGAVPYLPRHADTTKTRDVNNLE